jgi:uncharacterized protein YdcH (DUF465 family)
MGRVVLEEPQQAEVDDVVIRVGDGPVDLDDDQIKRLKEAGAKLKGPDEQDEQIDEIDQLKGDDLDNAVKDAEVEGHSTMTADEKRAELKRLRDSNGEQGGEV